MTPTEKPLALYIHWPYCLSKCPYCDFNSHVAATVDHDAWRAAYAQTIKHYAALLPDRTMTSIFFGGGTPSLMEIKTVESILQNVAAHWRMADDIEITLEANPTSVEAIKFAGLRAAGVNRLSLGIQSLRDDALKFLGRTHNADEAKQALELAAHYFPRYSFDLIYARHGQSVADWEQELREALAFGAKHMSLYQLTIEPNTQFYTLAKRMPLQAPEPESAVMFEATNVTMADAGLPAYEISNYAAAGHECRHNLTYWRYEDYIGIGPGAHGRLRLEARGLKLGKKERSITNTETSSLLLASPPQPLASEDHRSPDVWLKHVAEHGHGLRVCDPLDKDTAQREALMMGLRLTRGIDGAAWKQKFGSPIQAMLADKKLARLQSEGFITLNNGHLTATTEGLQRLNAVLAYLLG